MSRYVFAFEVVAFHKLRLANAGVNIVIRRLLLFVCHKFISITGSATEDFVLDWNMASVSWQIVFVVFNEGFLRHFLKLSLD